MHRNPAPSSDYCLLTIRVIKLVTILILASEGVIQANEPLARYCSVSDICKIDEEIAHNLLERAQQADAEDKRNLCYLLASKHFDLAYAKSKIIHLLAMQCWTMKLALRDPCEVKKCYMSLAFVDKQYEYAPNITQAIIDCKEPRLEWASPTVASNAIGKQAVIVKESYATLDAWEKKKAQDLKSAYPHRYRTYHAGKSMTIAGGIFSVLGFSGWVLGFACYSGETCTYQGDGSWTRTGRSPTTNLIFDKVMPGVAGVGFATFAIGTTLLLAVGEKFIKRVTKEPPPLYVGEPLGTIKKY